MNERNKGDHPSKSQPPWVHLSLATCLIVISLTCLGFMGGGVYYWAENAGLLERWQALGAPPEKAVEILTGDLNVIYVSTATGSVFGCEHEKVGDNSCWFAAQEPLKVDPEIRFDNPLHRGALKPPRGVIIDELDTTLWYADSAFQTRYVLLEDGKVWKWEFEKGLGSLLACIIGPLVGALLGIVVAIALWIYVGLRGSRRHNNSYNI